MDNQESLQQNVELPAPAGSERQSVAMPEVGASGELPSSGGAPTSTAATNPVINSNVQAIIGDTQITPPVAAPSVHLTAADADLIEKEWVEKAKQIVAQTTGDPYTQNKEINKIKADYIKKRYNKDIKVVSE